MKARPARRLLLGAVVTLLMAAVTAVGAPAASAAADGQVYLVHALAGSTVDVSLDGRIVARGAKPKTVSEPLALRPGGHRIVVTEGGKDIVNATFQVASGSNLDLVVHRTADKNRQPAVTVFRNDVRQVGQGKLRLVVSHVAVAPPADIRVDGSPLFRNVANGESLSLVVPARSVSVDVVPTATSGPAILAPVRLDLTAGTLTRVFAIGDPADNSMDAIVQVIKVSMASSRQIGKVASGDGGQAADSVVRSGPAMGTVLAFGVALVAIAGIGVLRGAGSADRIVGTRRRR